MSSRGPKYESRPMLFNKPWTTGLIVFIIVGALCFYAINEHYKLHQDAGTVNQSEFLASVIPIGILGLTFAIVTTIFTIYLVKFPARAAKRIQESELKYRTLVEQAGDGIFIANFQGQFIVVNPAGCKMSQYTEEELMAMRFHDLAVTSEVQAMPFKFDEIMSGKTATSERKMIRKNGEIIDVEISAKIIAPDRFLAFVRDITERKKVENELLRSREDLRQLTNYIENIREEERLHISREIHDELGQQLTVLKMDVSRLTRKLTDAGNAQNEEAARILLSINQMVETVRKISSELRPGMLDDLGLTAALEWYTHDFGKKFNIKTGFISNINEERFSKKLNISIFRIFQESLTNIARHAEASKLDVSLIHRGQQLLLLIEDNGKGFDTSIIQTKKTLGIMGMQERAIMIGGTYKVNSAPGKGTIIEVAVAVNMPDTIGNPPGHL